MKDKAFNKSYLRKYVAFETFVYKIYLALLLHKWVKALVKKFYNNDSFGFNKKFKNLSRKL